MARFDSVDELLADASPRLARRRPGRTYREVRAGARIAGLPTTEGGTPIEHVVSG